MEFDYQKLAEALVPMMKRVKDLEEKKEEENCCKMCGQELPEGFNPVMVDTGSSEGDE
jgi:hypothetical protein